MYKNHSRSLLAAVAIAQGMVALDMSVVNVALPAIRTGLGFDGGSLAGGLAQTSALLIGARAVQGLAAAALAPAALATLTTTFAEGAARTRALGVWSAVNAAGGAVGVLAGGPLTEYAGWRWVMLVNLPIAAIAAVLTLSAVPLDGPRSGPRARPDLAGAVLGTGGVALLILGVVRTDQHAWTTPATIVPLGAAVLLLAGFVLVESRVRQPLLRLGLLHQRNVASANLFAFLAAAAMFSAFYFVSLYLQQVLRLSSAATALAFLPFSAGTVVGSIVATRWATARGPRPVLLAGGPLAAAGFAWFGLISADGSYVSDVLGPMLVTSVGLGMCLAPLALAATSGVPATEAGMASSLVNSARQLGGSIGLAVLSTVALHNSSSGPTSGYSLGLLIAAALLCVATAVAFGYMPARSQSR
ncbi:MFS transporter [Kribbella sp. NPDC049174]|uniref:MFS transporter n=1 Tax=Kribbella sp. NPDC049174 TaxID=3364112 RepID=UPI003713FAE8